MVVEPFDASMKTLPSGAVLATEAAAISPLAPARFSTTTERFSVHRCPAPRHGRGGRSVRRAGSRRPGAVDDRENPPSGRGHWRGRPAAGRQGVSAARRRNMSMRKYARLAALREATK